MAAVRKAPGELYVATESFSTELDGITVAVVKGVTRVREGHPLMVGREMYFKPITAHFEVNSPADPGGETRG